jgi:hypothetical protein
MTTLPELRFADGRTFRSLGFAPARAGRDLLLELLALLVLVNSITQEVLVRGYVLQTIERSFGGAAAVLVSSLTFTGLHAGALVEGGILPGFNLFAAGLLLGVAFTTTRTLWLPIGLHFSWNFLQGPVLGIIAAPIAVLWS